MAFLDQVEDLTSLSIGDTDALSQFLKDGVIEVTSRCLVAAPHEISSFARVSSETTSNSSLDLNGAKIISVIRERGADGEWRPCRQILPSEQYNVVDEASLDFASKHNPVFMIGDDGGLSVFPTPSATTDAFKAYYVNNVPVDKSGSALIHSHSDIGYFADDKVYLVVMYAGMRALQAKMGDSIVEITAIVPIAPTLTVVSLTASNALASTGVAPTAPSAPSFTYTNASVNNIVKPLIDISDMTVLSADPPTYIKPVFSAPVMGSVEGLVLPNIPVAPVTSAASVGDYITGNSPTYVEPVVSATAFPSISWAMPSRPVTPNLATTLVSFSQTAPQFLAAIAPTVDYSGVVQALAGVSSVSSIVLPSLTYDSFPSLTWNFPQAPIAPSTSIATIPAYMTPPTYSKPVSSLEDAPTIEDLDITATVPVPPTLSDETTVDISGMTVPTYIGPAIASLTTFPTLTWAIPTVPIAPSMNAESSSSGGAEVDLSKLGTPPVYVAPVMSSPDYPDANTWINTEEDSEMLSSRMQVIQAQIAEYQAKLAESKSTFDAASIEYNAKLQIALQDAQFANTGDSSKIQKLGSQVGAYSSQVGAIVQSNQAQITAWQQENSLAIQKYAPAIQNSLNIFNTENAEYQASLKVAIKNADLHHHEDEGKLQIYQGELSAYQAEVGAQVQEYTQNAQKDTQLWQVERQTDIQSYQADLQNELNKFNEANVEYQADIQTKISGAKLEDSGEGRLIQKYQSEVQAYTAEIQGIVQENQAIIASWRDEWNLKTQKFSAETTAKVQKLQAEISAESNISAATISIFNAQLGKANEEMQAKLSLYQTNTQQQIHEFQQMDAAYKGQLEISLKNVDIHSKANQEELQGHATDVQAYATAISSIVSSNQGILAEWQAETQTDIQKYQADIQNALNKFNQENVIFQAALQENIKDADLEDVQEGRKLQAYQVETQAYTAEVNAKIQEWVNKEHVFDVYQAEWAGRMQEYQADVQSELNEFNKENVVYQEDVQRQIQNLQKDVQEAIQNAQNDIAIGTGNLNKDTQVELQNALQNFQKDIQEYTSRIGVYSAEMNGYQITTNKDVQEYTAQLQVDISNMQAAISNNQQSLERYQGEVAAYQAQITSETQEQNLRMQQYQALYNQIKTEYDGAYAIMAPQQQAAPDAAQQ